MHDIRPINSKKAYQAALEEIEALIEKGVATRSREGERLEVLAILVSAYEEKHSPIGPPAQNESVVFRMEQEGYTRADLAKLLGVGSGRVSELLAGKRPLTLEMVRRLHKAWGIPLESLVLPPRALATTKRVRRSPSRPVDGAA